MFFSVIPSLDIDICEWYNKTKEIDGHLWPEVEYNGKSGWVAADYLRISNPDAQVSGSDNSQTESDEFTNGASETDPAQNDEKSAISYSDHSAWKNNPFALYTKDGSEITPSPIIKDELENFFDEYYATQKTMEIVLDEKMLYALHAYLSEGLKNAKRPNNIGKGLWAKQVANDLKWVDNVFGEYSTLAKGLKSVPYISIAFDAGSGVLENVNNNADIQETATDIVIDVGFGVAGNIASAASSGAVIGTKLGTAYPVAGNILGAIAGAIVGIGFYFLTESKFINEKSIKDWADESIDWIVDGIKSWFS